MASKKSDYEYAQAHKYRTYSGGPFVPGVTTIINITDKPGMMWSAAEIAATSAIDNWRRKTKIIAKHREWLRNSKGKTDTSVRKRTLGEVGTDFEVYAHWARGEFDRQWRAKRDRGTRVHEIAEQWSRAHMLGETAETEVLDEDLPWIDALEKFYADYQPVFHLVECIVINSELDYGGRFDCIVDINKRRCDNSERILVLGDYKSGGHYPYEVALQAEGYWRARLAIFNSHGVLIGGRDLPQLDGARTIYLKDDGELEVIDPFETISRDDAWRAFSASRELFDAMKSINSQLGRNDDDN